MTKDLARYHVTVPRRLLDKLAAAKAARSHARPNATDADILEEALDLLIATTMKK
jgi:hypothetical protein